MKKWVFNVRLNESNDLLTRRSYGSSFHSLGPATENARSPYNFRCDFGMISKFLLSDRSPLFGLLFNLSERYFGAIPFNDLKTWSRTLYLIRNCTGSQCNSLRTGVMLSYFLVKVTNLAAVLRTLCNLLMDSLERPYIRHYNNS